MSIDRFFDKQLIVQRLRTVSGNRRAYNTTATVDAAFQSRERQARGEYDAIEDRLWIAYFDIEDKDKIQKEDKIYLGTTGLYYKVIAKTLKDYGVNQHVEVILAEYSE